MARSNAFWPGLTPFGPTMWQAEADTELTLSASPTTAVGQKALALAKRRYSTVPLITKVVNEGSVQPKSIVFFKTIPKLSSCFQEYGLEIT